MTKIKNTTVYQIKIPIATDYIVGSDSENEGKTVNFQFDSFVDFVNSVNGNEVISYTFSTSPIPDLDETGYGFFLSENNIINPQNITKLKISKKTKSGIDLSTLFTFMSNHESVFILKLRNLSDPNNFIYLDLIEITEQEFQFTFSVSINDVLFLDNLKTKNVYVLEFDLKSGTIPNLQAVAEVGATSTIPLTVKSDDGNTKTIIDNDSVNISEYYINDTAPNYEIKNEITKDKIEFSKTTFINPLDPSENHKETKVLIDYNKIELNQETQIGPDEYENRVARISADELTLSVFDGDDGFIAGTDYFGFSQAEVIDDPQFARFEILGDITESINIQFKPTSGIVAYESDLTTLGNTKLDKSTFTGNAQTLQDNIDAIYQPDVLISSIPPTRSVNTFTYPANQYKVLINKTVRTNPAQFVTTINAASTTNHKRVDLIYFKPDNTLAKIVGTEDLIIATIPNVPIGSVGISFINVFGNIIENPTPITNEISIQNYNGTEQFRITDYLRFKGVSFDASAKALITDPLVPLSAFLDIVNGNDALAVIENSNKPFKTIDALLNSLPITNGETYNIYIKNGTINFTRKVTPRNLNWIAYTPVILNFTNTMENDGVTHADNVFFEGNICTWSFINENISLECTYVGRKSFSKTTGGPDSAPSTILKGTINNLRWFSTSRYSYSGSVYINSNSNVKILNVYDSVQSSCIFNSMGDASMNIVNYRTQYGKSLFVGFNLTNIINLDNVIQIGTTNLNLDIAPGPSNRIGVLNFKSINMIGNLSPFASYANFDNCSISSTCNINFYGTSIMTGEIIGTNYHTSPFYGESNIANSTIFRNFKGKLGNILVYLGLKISFENCIIQTNTVFIERASNSAVSDLIFFSGSNDITQIDTSAPLFKASSTLPINITIDGALRTNAMTYGPFTSYVLKLSTFKEKLNEIVVRSKIDLVNKVLKSTTTYIIDANIVLLAGEYIQIPAGGLTIAGYGFDVSAISKNVAGQSIFTSPSGNSGNFVSRDMMYSPGAGTIFNITDSDGSHAIELNDINFQGTTGSSIGTISGYRQFTGTTCGFYGLSDGLTLEGNWSGFKLTNSNIIGFGASGTLFKKGTSLLFSNRFFIDLNIQIATGSKICDFSDSNFTNNKSLQVVNCYTKINGNVADNSTTPSLLTVTTATFPNITPYSTKSYFLNNIGIKNTTEVIESEMSFTLDGVQTVFNIPHGLGIIPKSFQLTFSDGSNTDFIQSMRTKDATNIIITCANVPAAGTIIVYLSVST